MAIVGCFPFISYEWQIYVLVFLLNVFNAFFTPTYRAVIPQIIEAKYYREAVGLSTAMAAFGIGAAFSAFLAGIYDKSKSRSVSLIAGALLLGLSICIANFVPITVLIMLWVIAGLGQSLKLKSRH